MKSTGAKELGPDEMPIDDEGGCDNATSTRKPLTSRRRFNCGHLSKEDFLQVLRLSRARPEVLNYVRRELECPACAAKLHAPKPRLPAAMPRTFRFKETLGVDLFEVESSDGTKKIFCNMLC